MDPNEEVLRQIRESKRVGEYMLQGYTPVDHGVFNQSIGYGNNSGGHISSSNIDADSFLKNLQMKNTKKIVYNPINQAINFKPNVFRSAPVNIPTKEKRACNDVVSGQDISKRFYSVGLKNPQSHINYDMGIDSRHEKR